MAVPAVAIMSTLALFICLARLGTMVPWSTFRRITTMLAALVVVTSLGAPLMAALLLAPILGARALNRPLAHVPDWFFDDAKTSAGD